MFELATTCHVSERNVTFVGFSQFLPGQLVQHSFLVSFNLGQCSIIVAEVLTVYTVTQVRIHFRVNIPKNHYIFNQPP